ncbi:MAG: hypothetical protein HYZ29_00600 [Myxococcales bacterium]|nr:hypothetical protein [Myxococcales bacterium]
MMKKAWRTLAAVGLVTSVGLVGCVVGSSDDDGTGGSSGSGGSGGSTGGSGGSTGGSGGSTGGSGGSTGGSGGVACEADDGGLGTPGVCTAKDPNDACQKCTETKCCAEWSACAATNPTSPCMEGGPANEGEIFCFQTCFIKELKNGADPKDAKGTCAGQCTTPGCGTIAGVTSELIACLAPETGGCFDECFPTN